MTSTDRPLPPRDEKGRVHVAVDGSAVGSNPGSSGWAWYISEDCWGAGTGGIDTNNRMELLALLKLLQAVEAHPEGPLVIHLDSQYTLQATTAWVHGWRRNGWRTKDGKDVKNVDLIRPIADLLAPRTATELVWVKGHSGHPLNEGADSKARAAAEAHRAGTPVAEGPGWIYR